MTKKVKAAWVAALRSGKYSQGQRHLEYGGKYCCLGVLCAITKHKQTYGAVRKLLGPELADKYQDMLVAMNDEKEKTFYQIAAYIQRYM